MKLLKITGADWSQTLALADDSIEAVKEVVESLGFYPKLKSAK